MNAATEQKLTLKIIAANLCVLAAFSISLFFKGYQDLHYAPAIAAIIVFSLLCILPAIFKGFQVASNFTASSIFLLWLFVTLSLTWSSVPYASLVTYLIFLAAPLCFYSPLFVPSHKLLLKNLFYILLFALAVLACWALAQSFFFNGQYGARVHHPLSNPNNLAGLLNLGLIPSISLFMCCSKEDTKKYLYFSLCLIFTTALLLTQSRAGIFCGFICSALLIINIRTFPDFELKRVILLFITGVIATGFLGVINDINFLSRFEDISQLSHDPTLKARIAIWGNTLFMLQDYFWLGTGFGTFYLYYPHYRVAGADNSTGHWAHMDPLQYWSEMGVFAPILFYGICIAICIRTIMAAANAKTDSSDRVWMLTFFFALMALIIHTHFTFHLYIMPILIVLGIWLSAWYHHSANCLNKPSYSIIELSLIQKYFMLFVTISIGSLIMLMSLSSAFGQHYLIKAHQHLKQGMVEKFVKSIEQSEKYAPKSFIDPEVKLAAFYIDLLDKNAAALFTNEEQESLYSQSLDLLSAASEMNPAWAEIDYQKARLYDAVSADIEPSKKQQRLESLELTLAKNPQHVAARRKLSEIHLQNGRVDIAYETLKTGLAFPHDKKTQNSFLEKMRQIKSIIDMKQSYEQKRKTSKE